MSQAIKDKDASNPDQYCAHLDKIAADFSLRFGELDIMEDIAAFVSNPFQSTDDEKVSAKFQQVFGLQSGVDMEIIDLQNDVELKSTSRDSDFWGLVSGEKSSPPDCMCIESECLLWIHLPLWNGIFADENNKI